MKNMYIISALCVIFGILLVNATRLQAYHPLLLKECRKGPSYWCSNISNAKDCYAIRHCIYTVWEKQPVPEDNNTICQICLNIVKKARIQLGNNKTEDDLKVVFEGSCQRIPVKPIQEDCLNLIENFIPEITEILSSRMTPEVACSVLELCNNSDNDKMLVEDVSIPTATEEIKIIPSTVEITTEGLPKNKLLVEDAIPFKNSIMLLIDKLMGVSQYETLGEHKRICTLCNLYLLFVQEAFSTPRNEDKVKLIVNTTCTKLPSSLGAECHNFMDEYGDLAIALFVHKIDPLQICSILKLCLRHVEHLKVSAPKTLVLFINANSIDSDKPSVADKQLQQMIEIEKPKDNVSADLHKKLEDNEKSYNAVDRKIIPIDHNEQDISSECSTCVKLVNEVEAKVTNKNSKEQIEHAMEMVCQKHRIFKNKCLQYIKAHGEQIENFIMSGYSQKKICSLLGWCTWWEVFDYKSSKTKV